MKFYLNWDWGLKLQHSLWESSPSWITMSLCHIESCPSISILWIKTIIKLEIFGADSISMWPGFSIGDIIILCYITYIRWKDKEMRMNKWKCSNLWHWSQHKRQLTGFHYAFAHFDSWWRKEAIQMWHLWVQVLCKK